MSVEARVMHLLVLGSIDLRALDGSPLAGVLAQPKRLALLTYLATARPTGFHRRDRLTALFWPDLDDAHARDALSQALRFLRRALGTGAIVARGDDEVSINASRLTCDVVEFRKAIQAARWTDALGLYGGDFLDGFFVDASAAFDEWLEEERRRLREIAASGARQLAEDQELAGARTGAVKWSRIASDLCPYDERALRRLMSLLDRAGDAAQALHAYREFAHRLERDLDTLPSTETRELVERIRLRSEGRPAVLRPPGNRAVVPDASRRAAVRGLEAGAKSADGRYVIEGVLEAGGMATVYLANDVRHDRRVAIKVLMPDASPQPSDRGVPNEIRLAAGLQHPLIVPVYDSGDIAGRPFYVMPRVAGETLRARLRRNGVFDTTVGLKVARDVANALAYAHACGIVHGDIKPENVLLAGTSERDELFAMITDFGIARSVSPLGQTERARPGSSEISAFGTIDYMAPEQLAGEAIDPRADVYGWGVLTYELLTGVHPFENGRGEPDRAPLERRNVPTTAIDLVIKCLHRLRDNRPASASDLLRIVAGVHTRQSGTP